MNHSQKDIMRAARKTDSFNEEELVAMAEFCDLWGDRLKITGFQAQYERNTRVGTKRSFDIENKSILVQIRNLYFRLIMKDGVKQEIIFDKNADLATVFPTEYDRKKDCERLEEMEKSINEKIVEIIANAT